MLPSRRDPRLRVAMVLLTVQVLGQTVLGFKLSIAQILVTLATAALIDVTVVYRRDRALVWPASALLTGNSIALLLRATGTEHGDWWSLNGVGWFVLAVVLSLASKHLVQWNGRHVFNPSNVGLVWTLLVIGPSSVFPQYLYWGPLGVPVVLTTLVLVVGGIWVLRPLRMLPMVVAFLVTLGVLVGGLALSGAEFFAIWHSGPVTGWFYWVTIVWSPETLVFVLFMMSDPSTSPRAPRQRVMFGAVTAAVAAVMLSFQPTEFGVKLALLASLTVWTAMAPIVTVIAGRAGSASTQPRRSVDGRMLATVAIILVGATVMTASLAGDERLLLLEQGRSGIRNPQ